MTSALAILDTELYELLVEKLQLIDADSFAKAKAMSRRLGMVLERALVESNQIPYSFLLDQIAQSWQVDFIDVKSSEVDEAAMRRLTEDYATANLLIPFRVDKGKLCVAMANPRNKEVVREIERVARMPVRIYLAPSIAIRRCLLLYNLGVRAMMAMALNKSGISEIYVNATPQEAPSILDQIFRYAALTRSSDIHIEPHEFQTLVRCRIDGILKEVVALPPPVGKPLISRMKVISSMRIEERRAPQDGRAEIDRGVFRMNVRTSTLPTMWGEKVVLRVLSRQETPLDLEQLGLIPKDYERVQRNIMRPHGMMLITGPTGSGKTSTLYAMLLKLGAEHQNLVNISTIEDPIEYTIPRANQVAVDSLSGLTFSSGLRALLRQDPDIIMVGEIRDSETAEMAVRSALVGRLLFSTIHTNDSAGAIPRLIDLGTEPFRLASTLSMVVAQRLVRRICPNCRQSSVPDPKVMKLLMEREDLEPTIQRLQSDGVLRQTADPFAGIRLFEGKGCDQCNGTGFRGRLGVFEILEVTPCIQKMIMERQDAASMRKVAVENGMKTLFQDGLTKALLGETSVQEVLRVSL